MTPPRRRLRDTIDGVLRTAALVGFGCLLITSLPRWASRVASFSTYGVVHAAETPAAALRRLSGPEVSAAYDRLLAAIPPDGAYVLVDGGILQQGSTHWVRYRLAPRRAVLAGDKGRLPTRQEVLQGWPAEARWAVVALPEGRPPVLLEREVLLALLAEAHARR